MQEIKKKTLTVMLAAGGTGGHMIPAEAVGDDLKKRGHHVALITDPRGDRYPGIMEGFDRHVLSTSGMSGGLLGKVKGMISLAKETGHCRRLLKDSGADMVIGFGGYPSMPAVAAAKALGIPYILHEQNTVLGRVNRLMARGAMALALSYENTKRLPENVEYFVTGNPVRAAVLAQAQRSYQQPDDEIRLLIMGGSQGAHILSKIIPSALAGLDAALRGKLVVMHQAREEDKDQVAAIYKEAGIPAEVESYFLDIPERLASVHLVISRAGASSLSEFAVIGVPSILVPLKIAMDDHQTTNAADLERHKGAVVMAEDDFSVEKLSDCLSGLFADTKRLKAMADGAKAAGVPDSAQRVVKMIEKVSERL